MEPNEEDTQGVSAEEVKVETYLCTRCGKNHRYDSRIGREHLEFIYKPVTEQVEAEDKPEEEDATTVAFSKAQGLKPSDEGLEENPWDVGYSEKMFGAEPEVELPAVVVSTGKAVLTALLSRAPKLGDRAHANPMEIAEFRLRYAEWLLELWSAAAEIE